MVKSLYASDIRKLDSQYIEDALLAVTNIQLKADRKGKPFLLLQLADRTGSIEARDFNCADIPTEYKIGDPVSVSGTCSQEWGIHLTGIQKYAGRIDPGDFLAACPKDVDSMQQELLGIIGSVGNSHLRTLLAEVFLLDEEAKAKFERWPAAEEVHHAYIGGLLEHTLSVAKLGQRSAEFYKVDKDLLVAGALLHDIGKLQELDCGLTVVYTDMGRLLGHSLLGYLLVRDKISAIKDFPELLSHQILHIIASHHGKREWGAIVAPMTLEAFLVFILDYADFKASRYEAKIEEQRPLEPNVSPWDRVLETRVYAPPVEGEL